MAKNSVSEWSTVSSGNGDIAGLTLGLDMPPSYVNNSIQEMMAQIKQWKDGYTDPLTGLPVYQSQTVENIDVEGNANFKGGLKLDGSYGNNGQVIVSQGASANPTWGDAFVRGMIMLWSGSTGTVPSGWALCNGANGTPNLRDRFIVGAGGSYAVNATGGSANATLPSHSHSGATSNGGAHTHSVYVRNDNATNTNGDTLNRPNTGVLGDEQGTKGYRTTNGSSTQLLKNSSTHTHSFTTNSTGSSGTNANLPPYYALAYIMKL